MNLKTLDLFSGCGGLSLGFEQAGFKVKLANDIWSIALKTFVKNFSHVITIQGDINKPEIQRQIVEACNNEIDIVIGGPPCQAYSLAGSRDPEDPRGKLFNSYVDIVKKIKPKAFVIENVKGILSMKHFRIGTPEKIKERHMEIIRERKSKSQKVSIESLNYHIENYLIPVTKLITNTFKKIGYKVEFTQLNSANYGVPQERLRVFFIGTKSGKKIKFPRITHSNKRTLDLKPYVTLKEAIGDLPFPEVSKEDEVYIGSYSPIYMSRNRRRGWNEVSYTIQAGQRHIPLHPESPPMTKMGEDEWKFGDGPIRRLSVRECARVQTFPDSFEFYGSTAYKYKQIGNAVPPLLGKKVAESVLDLL